MANEISRPAQNGMQGESPYSCHCTPASCRERCGHEVLDVLLYENAGGDRQTVDRLLDLKFAITQRDDAEEVIEIFCKLRQVLEKRYYLAFYRLRRWLENQVVVRVNAGRGYEEHTCPLKLEKTSPEAILAPYRRTALSPESVLPEGWPVRITFEFTPQPQPAQALPA